MAIRATLLVCFAATAESLRLPSAEMRRGVLQAAAALAVSAPFAATAEEEAIPVYFGCGCFWHVQHEFVEAERKILGRKDSQLTALSGYAGGNAGAKNGKVCYHNAALMSDYGSLGHAEVVGMRIPPSKFYDFAVEYAKLFDEKGNRPDQNGDRGPEYRNVVGIPGGAKSPLAKVLVEASAKNGDKLDFASGKGDDPDARAVAFVMDSNAFPFYQAEPYHQFHDGFAWGEDYPVRTRDSNPRRLPRTSLAFLCLGARVRIPRSQNSYNSLAKAQLKAKVVQDTGCPNGMLGVGIAGL